MSRIAALSVRSETETESSSGATLGENESTPDLSPDSGSEVDEATQTPKIDHVCCDIFYILMSASCL